MLVACTPATATALPASLAQTLEKNMLGGGRTNPMEEGDLHGGRKGKASPYALPVVLHALPVASSL